MEEWVSDLTLSLSSVFGQEDIIQRVVELIKSLGVCSTEDLKYVEADDLAGILKPVEVRKVMNCIKRNSPLSAKMFMVAVDRILVNEQLQHSISDDVLLLLLA